MACFNNSVVCQGSEAHCSGIVGSVPGLHDKEGCLTLGPIHKSRVGGGLELVVRSPQFYQVSRQQNILDLNFRP